LNEVVYIPLLSVKNEIILSNEKSEIKDKVYFYPYVLLVKNDETHYIELFQVFINKKMSDFNIVNTLELPSMSFDEKNTFIEVSFKSTKPNNQFQNKTSACEIIDWFIVTTYSNGAVTEDYVGSSASCNDQGLLEDGLSTGGWWWSSNL